MGSDKLNERREESPDMIKNLAFLEAEPGMPSNV